MGEGGCLTAAAMTQKQLQLLADPTRGSGELQPGALIPRRGLTGLRICSWQLSQPTSLFQLVLRFWKPGEEVGEASKLQCSQTSKVCFPPECPPLSGEENAAMEETSRKHRDSQL